MREARGRHGLDRAAQEQGSGASGLPGGSMGLGLRAGIEVVSALIAGVALGWVLDRWLGTFPWLLLLGFVLGAAAGILNVYRLFAPRRGIH
nr:AtpZ/AtpI family protein [Roseomonas acroporae]